eukprot:CAMPEP_0198117744 /NCGR_PEP_ID=MMETSP1442-20131203/19170_1 /TAXON_ID= /ORGANISM="Craspedostauros australis, Strain CCMP3328" /LENGTH=159 /DNA_ID=CAMNT_0043775861 /DNA_START=196 /DNA_END=675 /DNA_ORIENTATION=-
MTQAAVGANFSSATVHLAVPPLADVPATVVPCHSALAMEAALLELALVFRSIHEDALTCSVAHSIHPGSVVHAAVLVRHLSLNHLAAHVLSLEQASIGKVHLAATVLVVVAKAAFIEVAVAVGETAVAGPSSVAPVALVPPARTFVFETAASVGHAGGS